MKCNLCGNPLFVIADLSLVIADSIRNPVHPNAWMPDHVRHDNTCAAVTLPMNKAGKPWRFARVGKPRWIREGSPC